MKAWLLLTFCIVHGGVSCAKEFRPSNFGIGFALHFDYGVVSVYHSNGSSSGIAKIEGSWAYKQMMHHQSWLGPEPYNSAPTRSVEDLSALQSTVIGTQGLVHHLPPWLGGSKPDARVKILRPMFKALNAAALAYTDTTGMIVAVTFAAQPSKGLVLAARSAASGLAIKKAIVTEVSPASLAADANGLTTEPCHGDGDYSGKQLILAVDYSRSAFSSNLLSMECGLYDDLRVMVNTSLGLADWSGDTHQTLAAELRRFIRPVHGMYDERLQDVDSVLLTGEAGHNEKLRSVLQGVFGSSHTSTLGVRAQHEDDAIDPLFATSIGAAYYAWSLLQADCGVGPCGYLSGHGCIADL
ncbi:hypothetical protein B0A48_00743 [Cryoendolithus antarcticus]|uniref:Uncharacterized protein n=1 Tax=Cryoendolithus antarcticus TaxID=1507870 RepID=A0A1V8TRD9_9PEZI|nr:hypothetical protein B0A48_00743 [Cryoendolithus antarcticus]